VDDDDDDAVDDDDDDNADAVEDDEIDLIIRNITIVVTVPVVLYPRNETKYDNNDANDGVFLCY
jgi:hypothetical protein